MVPDIKDQAVYSRGSRLYCSWSLLMDGRKLGHLIPLIHRTAMFCMDCSASIEEREDGVSWDRRVLNCWPEQGFVKIEIDLRAP